MRTVVKAILTGHSQGLGAAMAMNLLHRGIPVLGIARGFSDVIAGHFPQLCTQAQISLDDLAALTNWLATSVLKDFLDGGSEILLINNAGIVQPVGALQDQDPLEVARAISLNVAAPLMLAAAVVQATPGKQRRILHISSGAARSAYPGWSVYCATKAALDHHARAAMLDAVPGLLVCSLAPGVIDTAMQAQIRATPEERFPRRERFLEMHKQGELVSPQDCAHRLVDYLLAAKFGREPVDDLRN